LPTEPRQTDLFRDPHRRRGRNLNRSTVACRNGIVCASEPLAAMAGVDILKAGGHCVDAAIAVNAMLGLTEPAMNGIGGDLFAIVWDEAAGKLVGLNASGRAPARWTLEQAASLQLREIPSQSPLAWSVPGCVSGWSMLSERFGRIPLGRCLAPAIETADAGFPLAPISSEYFSDLESPDSSLAEVYAPAARPLQFGDVFSNASLAHSYRLIAEGGADAFYEGEIAEKIVTTSARLGGFISLDDLAAHESDWVDPISTSYRGYEVWELPPNGQGIAVLQMLNLLEHFDIASLAENSVEHLHLFVEAKRLAYADRARYYADPDFAAVPVAELISKDYAASRVGLIDPRRAASSLPPGDVPVGGDTVYLTVADGDGNMISLIQSIYGSFGSRICPDGTGFAMQNRGIAFSLDPDHPNRLEPRKRPFHTIIPGFVTRAARPVIAFGVMGGDFQPQGQVQVLMNMLDFRMSPQEASDQPRASHEGNAGFRGEAPSGNGQVFLEKGISSTTRAGLTALGHTVSDSTPAWGGYQAIWREDDPLRYFGGSDARKDGGAFGY
jgi:gamma-glutamyltranspeptidase/glutathione hydrolase